MRQTDKYHFNLIETSDTFSPDPMNENTQAVETQLAALAANHDALAAATAASDSALQKTDAANKTALEQSIASTKTALEQSIASAKSALQTAIGSGGKTARIYWGSYVGDGNNGKSHPNSLTFDFKAHLVAINRANTNSVSLLLRDVATATGPVTWGDRQVSWYSTASPTGQMNVSGMIYYYVAIGESL